MRERRRPGQGLPRPSQAIETDKLPLNTSNILMDFDIAHLSRMLHSGPGPAVTTDENAPWYPFLQTAGVSEVGNDLVPSSPFANVIWRP